MAPDMSIKIKGDTFTTSSDLWEASNLSQAEKDEIQFKIALVGKLAIVPENHTNTAE
jgi:hypothetical protein